MSRYINAAILIFSLILEFHSILVCSFLHLVEVPSILVGLILKYVTFWVQKKYFGAKGATPFILAAASLIKYIEKLSFSKLQICKHSIYLHLSCIYLLCYRSGRGCWPSRHYQSEWRQASYSEKAISHNAFGCLTYCLNIWRNVAYIFLYSEEQTLLLL